ncbi:MAG: helix-turn-helix domain-containing protein [Moorellaceae bacterium]
MSFIKNLRKAKKMTQAALARQANLYQCYLSEIERGAKTPSVHTLQRLATALGVPVGLLLEEIGKPNSRSPKKD